MAANPALKFPRVGLFACFSGGSNTGTLTGIAALEVVRRLGEEAVGICSLPAILNQVHRQSALVKKIEKLIVIDGCHNDCARHLLAKTDIAPSVYLNLESDLNISKQGPFSSLDFTDEEVNRVADAIIARIQETEG
jgi:uncharacterized metal-binding protein